MQVKILRVLQEKEFERVGDSTPVKIDCRFIAATHRNLPEMITRQTFREDLFYRVNVIPIRLPSLRERREDIPLLIEHFMEVNRLKTGKDISGVSKEAMDAMLDYPWPGNIRELINAVEYAFVVCREAYIEIHHLPEIIKSKKIQSAIPREGREEKDRILDAIRQAGGKKADAAKLLGISRQALWKKITKYSIKSDY